MFKGVFVVRFGIEGRRAMRRGSWPASAGGWVGMVFRQRVPAVAG
jgi:hypothetical protein